MKIPLIQLLAIGAFALGAGITVQAGGAGPGARGAASQRAAAEAAEVTALRPAFTIMVTADHDYDGHRARAMVALAEACRLMGTDIVPPGLRKELENAGSGTRPHETGAGTKPATRGAGRHPTTEPETQSASDAQMLQAQGIIQKVRNGIATGKQPRVTARLDEAIKEIGIALSLK
jgi:hypothetical protein